MDQPTSAALTAAYRRRVEAWQGMQPHVAEAGRDRALADLALLDGLAAHTGDHALRGAALLALTTAFEELGENELVRLTRRVAARFAAWTDAALLAADGGQAEPEPVLHPDDLDR